MEPTYLDFKGMKLIHTIAAVATISLVFISIYSLNLQIKNTSLQLKDFERKEKERLNKIDGK